MLVRRLIAAAVGAAIVTIAAATPAGADTPAAPTERDAPSGGIGVSVPPEPIRAVPGTTVELPLRITNPTAQPVTVLIEQRALHVGDGGQLQILDRPDPRWHDHLGLPAKPLNVLPGGHRDVILPLRVPTLSPDIHLIGVLVTPSVQTAGVRVVTAVGASFALEVPGPRDRRLDGSLRVPGIIWGRARDAELVVRNVGDSSLRFWGEHSQGRIEKTLLPAGRHRSVTVNVRSTLGIGVKSVDARIFYTRTDAEVVELEFSRQVVFVHPAYPAAMAAIIAIALLRLASPHARRRRRRRAMRPRYAI